jgi:beta-glucosidase
VVQLYLQLRGTSTAQPVRALKGFQRIALAPGETKRVKFELKPQTWAIWNDRNEFAAEPAKVKVWISPDSVHGSAAEAEILSFMARLDGGRAVQIAFVKTCRGKEK